MQVVQAAAPAASGRGKCDGRGNSGCTAMGGCSSEAKVVVGNTEVRGQQQSTSGNFKVHESTSVHQSNKERGHA